MELKDCIGKHVYGTDSEGREHWIVNLISVSSDELECDQCVYADSGMNYYSVNISCYSENQDFEGTFKVLAVFDTPQALIDDLMSKIATQAGYPGIRPKSLPAVHLDHANLDVLRTLYGKYIFCRPNYYATWIFDLKNIVKTLDGNYRATASSVWASSSDDDVNKDGTTLDFVRGGFNDVEVFDSVEGLLENIKAYIKEQIEYSSGIVI